MLHRPESLCVWLVRDIIAFFPPKHCNFIQTLERDLKLSPTSKPTIQLVVNISSLTYVESTPVKSRCFSLRAGETIKLTAASHAASVV